MAEIEKEEGRGTSTSHAQAPGKQVDEGEEGKESTALPPSPSEQPAPISTHTRKDLVDLAVKFLTNPRVQGSPMQQKRAFLIKKGLTDAEINTAVGIAQSSTNDGVSMGASNQIAVPPRPPPPLPLRSRSWSEYALLAVVVGGIGYAVVRLVRHYIIPWLESPRIQEQKVDEVKASVQQLQESVDSTVSSIKESTQAIRDLLSEQQRQIQLLTTQVTALQGTLSSHGGDQPLREIKDEVSSLKGLMLNRHQFPTPTRQGIPVWQRATSIPGSTPPPSLPPPSFSSPSSKLPPIQNGAETTNFSPNAVEDSEEESRPSQAGPTGIQTGTTGSTSRENGLLEESPQEWHDATGVN